MTHLKKGGTTSLASLTLLILILAHPIHVPAQTDAVGESLTTTGDPTSTVIPGTFFGLTVQHSSTVPMVANGTVRSWDALPGPDWADSNPARGVYNFASLDAFIAANEPNSKNKLTKARDMIYTLGRTPAWASSEPQESSAYGAGECAPPSSMTYWDEYLTAVVHHAAGRIKYWEIWNEPNNPIYWCGTIPTLVTMAQHARMIIKNLDPEAVILSPGMAGRSYGQGWMSQWLAAGGAATIDVISFHGYWTQVAEDVLSSVTGYQAAMEANGIGSMPMWDTEADGKIMPNTTATANFLSKYYLLQWSAGVSRFLWYSYDGSLDWGQLWNSSTGLNAAGKAYAETYNWMVGAKMARPCAQRISSTWSCYFTRNSYQAVALWNSNTTIKTTLPANFIQYRGLDGVVHPITDHEVTVNTSPILAETGNEP